MPHVWLIFLVLCQATTQPTDPTMDWLLDSAAPTTQPTTQPAEPTTQPSPFIDKVQKGEVEGTIVLSDDTVLSGIISTTPGKPIRLWSDEKKRYFDLPIESIASLEAVILWEREEPEYRFKESGFDEKVFTGHTYPARETQYKVKLLNDDELIGGIVAPLYIRKDGQTKQFVLHKRDKGAVDQRLKDLVYVKRITLR